jgi:hypothetical protein
MVGAWHAANPTALNRQMLVAIFITVEKQAPD